MQAFNIWARSHLYGSFYILVEFPLWDSLPHDAITSSLPTFKNLVAMTLNTTKATQKTTHETQAV